MGESERQTDTGFHLRAHLRGGGEREKHRLGKNGSRDTEHREDKQLRNRKVFKPCQLLCHI